MAAAASQRSQRIRRSVTRAIGEWHKGAGHAVLGPDDREAGADQAEDALERSTAIARVTYRAGILYTAFRIVLWIWAALRYYLGAFGDAMLRRNTIARRARRLRHIFEGLGPTFIKVGQQLSVRADLLPFEFCRELSLMLDDVPAMRTKVAHAIIRRAIGAELTAVFAAFDDKPIGSASLACVYKAQLHSGEWVAVKVRRPGISRRLTADIRALASLLKLAEWLSVFKPGFTVNLRTELARMLFEETDFLREARNAEVFLREVRASRQDYLTAPRVYFDLSTEDVLVMEYVTGTFVTEIIRALDHGDTEFLDGLRASGIDLPQVARNMVMAAHWELQESILFHADPHPANLCIQPGNVIAFIDFGSCGRLTAKYRRIWQGFYHALGGHNVQSMVDSAIAILEPLPPIDVEGFRREIELMFWDWVYAMNSDHAEWWEKASGLLWLKFAGMARRYQVYMSAEIVRIFRATFIYDTTIFQLSRSLDMRDEFARYHREAGRRARRRLRKAAWRRLRHGLAYGDYVELERLLTMGRQALVRVQHFLDMPSPNFSREIGKLSYTVSLLVRLGSAALTVYLLSVIGVNAYEWVTGTAVDVSGPLGTILQGAGFRVIAGVILLVLLRKAAIKLREQDAT